MVNTTSAGPIGVVLFACHGDRSGVVFQDYTTYNSTQGYLTPYGSLDVRADAGGGNVIYDSATALLQGLYPPTTDSKSTLANGQTAEAPLGGYQYIPVESLEFSQTTVLTGWMYCEYVQLHLGRVKKAVLENLATQAAPFLEAIRPYINGTDDSILNIWNSVHESNIYDYVNVQYTHNEEFHNSFPETLLHDLHQARYFADIDEQYVFTDTIPYGIGQMAIRTLWQQIFLTLGNMTLPDNKVKLALTEVDYKPFISMFNVTNATVTNPEISGLADYASAVAFELSQNTAGDYEVALKFKNGTNDNELKPLKLFGQDKLTLPQLIKALDWTAINSTINRCFACNQTVLRGCSVFNYSNDAFLHPNGN